MNIKYQKGFIQTPLLLLAIVSVVLVSAGATSAVLYKQDKLPFLSVSILDITKEEVGAEVQAEEARESTTTVSQEVETARQEAQEAKAEVEKLREELEQVKQKEVVREVVSPIIRTPTPNQRERDFEEFVREATPINNLIIDGIGDTHKGIMAHIENIDAVFENREYDVLEPIRFFNIARAAFSTAGDRAVELSKRTSSKNMWVVDNMILASDLSSEAIMDLGDWLFNADLSEQGKENKRTEGDIKYTRAKELTEQVNSFLWNSGIFDE